MTYEEANKPENIIKELNKRRMYPCGYCTDDNCIPSPLLECKKEDFVINKAIEALEKQIKKKPLIKRPSTACPEMVFKCPVCKCELDDTAPNDYCPDCGQSIYWSDAE